MDPRRTQARIVVVDAGSEVIGKPRPIDAVGPCGVEMIDGDCPNCGAGAGVLAKACPDCGAPIRLRPAGMLVAGALVILAAAIVLALVVVLRGQRLAAATETGAPADEQIAATSTADFSWLATAMSGCDAEAKTEWARLTSWSRRLFSVAKDVEPLRAKSINDMGDAILLRSDDALDGLKAGTLRIYPADYGFGIFDSETTRSEMEARGGGGEAFDRRRRRHVGVQRAIANRPQRQRSPNGAARSRARTVPAIG